MITLLLVMLVMHTVLYCCILLGIKLLLLLLLRSGAPHITYFYCLCSNHVQWLQPIPCLLMLWRVRASSMVLTRACRFPLPNRPGQVKLPVWQDLNRFFFFIWYMQIEEFQHSWESGKWWFWEKASPVDPIKREYSVSSIRGVNTKYCTSNNTFNP